MYEKSYEKEITVYQYECDVKNRMTAAALLKQVQQISTEHCLLSIHEYGFPAVEDILAVSSGNPGRRKAEAGDSALLAGKGSLPSVYQRL